jgi:RimJ/RimL family protein N-acetyltransferase
VTGQSDTTWHPGVAVADVALGYSTPRSSDLEMKLRFITKTVVYESTGPSDGRASLSGLEESGWQLADSRTVQVVFRDDPRRLQRFQSYLRANYVGLFLVRGGQWISYGWYSHPHSGGPPHLPRWSGKLGACWIFGCHTRPSFRQQGFYKELLARLTAIARQRQPGMEIYIDTYVNNVPSRKAILASGFEPCGVATTYRGWAPMVGSCVLAGRWRRGEAHPEMGGGILGVPAAAVSGVTSIAGGASLKDSVR